jgi:hypothetical protein
MIVDDTLVFSDGQAITADASSANIIDLGAAGTAYGHSSAVRRDIGIGTEIPVFISVTETFDNLTSMTVSLQVDDDAAFGSPTTIATSAAIPLATLVAGYKFTWPAELPEGVNERYVRLYYDVTGTAPTTGKVFAGVVAGRQTN